MSGYTIPNVLETTARGGERSADIFSRLLSDRIVYLGTGIDDGVANTVIAQVLHLENDAPDRPIQLYLNSEGGDAQAVLAIHDALAHVRCEVARRRAPRPRSVEGAPGDQAASRTAAVAP